MSSPSWYFASRFSNRHFLANIVRPDLLRAGHKVTSRWIDDSHDDCCPANAIRDVQDLEIADGVLNFLNEPRCLTRGGQHFELGLAYALGKKLVIIGVERGHIFHHLPEVAWFPDWAAAKSALVHPRESLRDTWHPGVLAI